MTLNQKTLKHAYYLWGPWAVSDHERQLQHTRSGALYAAQDDPHQQNGILSTHHPDQTPEARGSNARSVAQYRRTRAVVPEEASGDPLPRPQDDGERPAVPQHLRHRRRSPRRQRRGRSRPGAFFKHDRAFERWRKRYNPYHLGYADWLLWRAAASPFRHGSYRDQAYQLGFKDAKREIPKPKMPRITHFLNGGK